MGCKDDGMFGGMFFADGLLCARQTSSQRFDGVSENKELLDDGFISMYCSMSVHKGWS